MGSIASNSAVATASRIVDLDMAGTAVRVLLKTATIYATLAKRW